ncbi:MAG TPA: aldolase/citrate lyase family protein [Chloroflexota bacterium]|nr:aldolase/citrate lyase family protein [Chloroflexota bacterium]
MRENRVKALWREGKPVSVGWLGSADGYVVETMAQAGFDALVVDMQHGMAIGPDRAAAAFQVISTTETVPVVRVPWNDPVPIQYALDAGAYGVIVPMVNSREEALKAVGACRYPPLGYRSNGANRVRYYAGPDYFAHANQQVICLVMIETVEAVERIEEIASVPGLDGFYIGPTDLAISLGLPPRLDHPDARHATACQKVLDAARAHGLTAGLHCTGPEEGRRRCSQGFNFNAIGGDVGFVAAGARATLERFRAE